MPLHSAVQERTCRCSLVNEAPLAPSTARCFNAGVGGPPMDRRVWLFGCLAAAVLGPTIPHRVRVAADEVIE